MTPRASVGEERGESPDFLTTARIAEIEVRVAAATPGAWWHQVTTACYDVIEGGDRTSDSRYIAMMGTDFDGHDSIDAPNVRADAELIAHAPTDLRFLLDRVRSIAALERIIDERDEAVNGLTASVQAWEQWASEARVDG